MTSITIQLTSEQEKFLKLFASNHYPGAVDNLATEIPIHVVQTQTVDYIPVDEQYAEVEPYDVVFSSSMLDADEIFDTPAELVRAYYDPEGCPVEVLEYADAKDKEITGTNGNSYFIYSIPRYFEAYGIDGYGIEYASKGWHDVAFFFILKEAKRYIEQQAHNLKKPRVYSCSPGYSNEGEYRHFYELLRTIGNNLLAIEADEDYNVNRF